MIYMLDTNAVSNAAMNRGKVRETMLGHSPSNIFVSNIVLAELMYGFAKKSRPTLQATTEALLSTMTVLDWDDSVSDVYPAFRVGIEAKGRSLSYMDMLIAAHAHSIGAILVSSDAGMHNALASNVVDWY